MKRLLGVLAAAAWFGVLLQLYLSLGLAFRSGQSVGQGLLAYLGYFTVLTNILVAVVSCAGLMAPRSAMSSAWLRGCATTSIVLVGLSYHFLLRTLWNPQGLQWVADMTLHYVVPLGTLACWVIAPPTTRLSPLAPLTWSIYPCAYFVYTLVRGELIGSYPYFFIDVGELGYPGTVVNAVGLLACFIALGFVILYIGRFRQSRAQR